jgi:hypothetical protein
MNTGRVGHSVVSISRWRTIPTKHHRRSNRLREHDYSGGGAYFITICAQDKKWLFGRVAEGEMILNDAGRTVQRVWEDLPRRFPTVVLDVFQLMPNHLHGILVIPGAELEEALALATGAPVIQPGPKAGDTASRVRQAVPLRWAGLSERSNPLRLSRSIASNLVLEGVCCRRISTSTSQIRDLRTCCDASACRHNFVMGPKQRTDDTISSNADCAHSKRQSCCG